MVFYHSSTEQEGSSNVNGGVNSNGVGGGADVSDGSADMEDGRTSDMMDLSSAPGVEYLSTPERRLCSELHLLPGYYLVVKVGREPGTGALNWVVWHCVLCLGRLEAWNES